MTGSVLFISPDGGTDQEQFAELPSLSADEPPGISARNKSDSAAGGPAVVWNSPQVMPRNTRRRRDCRRRCVCALLWMVTMLAAVPAAVLLYEIISAPGHDLVVENRKNFFIRRASLKRVVVKLEVTSPSTVAPPTTRVSTPSTTSIFVPYTGTIPPVDKDIDYEMYGLDAPGVSNAAADGHTNITEVSGGHRSARDVSRAELAPSAPRRVHGELGDKERGLSNPLSGGSESGSLTHQNAQLVVAFGNRGAPRAGVVRKLKPGSAAKNSATDDGDASRINYALLSTPAPASKFDLGRVENSLVESGLYYTSLFPPDPVVSTENSKIDGELETPVRRNRSTTRMEGKLRPTTEPFTLQRNTTRKTVNTHYRRPSAFGVRHATTWDKTDELVAGVSVGKATKRERHSSFDKAIQRRSTPAPGQQGREEPSSPPGLPTGRASSPGSKQPTRVESTSTSKLSGAGGTTSTSAPMRPYKAWAILMAKQENRKQLTSTAGPLNRRGPTPTTARTPSIGMTPNSSHPTKAVSDPGKTSNRKADSLQISIKSEKEVTSRATTMRKQGASHTKGAELSSCLKTWLHWGDSCYKAFPWPATWNYAKQFCQKRRANIASVHSASENGFLLDRFGPVCHAGRCRAITGLHIGLTDSGREGHYVWTDGSPVDFRNWSADQPSNSPPPYGDGGGEDCTELRVVFGFGHWNDISCISAKRPFVCKAPASEHRRRFTDTGIRH